jgi:phosphate/sulfate permease
MNMKSRIVSCAFVVAVAIGALSAAQAFGDRVGSKNAKSGEATRIWMFFNCNSHAPFSGTGFVEHGTLSFKDAVSNKCGNASEPVREVWYTSNPGFTGADTVTIPTGSKGSVVISVAVH